MLGLLEGVLAGTTIEDEHYIMRCIRHKFLHNALNLRKLVHQAFLVVQTACSIDENDICVVCNCAVECIESHTGWVAAHLLLDDWNANPFAPNTYLLNCSSTECVGCSKHDLQASFLELIGELAYSCGLAHTIHAYNKDNIRSLIGRDLETFSIVCIVFRKQLCDFIAKNVVELVSRDVLVSFNSSLDALDNVEGRIHAYITCNEDFLKVVEHLVIYLRLACNGTRQFAEETFLRLLKPLIERFLLLFGKEIKESHIFLCLVISRANIAKKAQSIANNT